MTCEAGAPSFSNAARSVPFERALRSSTVTTGGGGGGGGGAITSTTGGGIGGGSTLTAAACAGGGGGGTKDRSGLAALTTVGLGLLLAGVPVVGVAGFGTPWPTCKGGAALACLSSA